MELFLWNGDFTVQEKRAGGGEFKRHNLHKGLTAALQCSRCTGVKSSQCIVYMFLMFKDKLASFQGQYVLTSNIICQSWALEVFLLHNFRKFYFYYFLSVIFYKKQIVLVVLVQKKAIFRAGHLCFWIENNLYNRKYSKCPALLFAYTDRHIRQCDTTK